MIHISEFENALKNMEEVILGLRDIDEDGFICDDELIKQIVEAYGNRFSEDIEEEN